MSWKTHLLLKIFNNTIFQHSVFFVYYALNGVISRGFDRRVVGFLFGLLSYLGQPQKIRLEDLNLEGYLPNLSFFFSVTLFFLLFKKFNESIVENNLHEVCIDFSGEKDTFSWFNVLYLAKRYISLSPNKSLPDFIIKNKVFYEFGVVPGAFFFFNLYPVHSSELTFLCEEYNERNRERIRRYIKSRNRQVLYHLFEGLIIAFFVVMFFCNI